MVEPPTSTTQPEHRECNGHRKKEISDYRDNFTADSASYSDAD